MALKTLSSADKAAFQKAGYNVTPAFEHVAVTAAENIKAKTGTAIDWQKWIQLGVTLISAILAIFGGTVPPAPTKKAVAVGCCDHCACICCQIQLTLDLLHAQTQYMCDCMDECDHCG